MTTATVGAGQVEAGATAEGRGALVIGACALLQAVGGGLAWSSVPALLPVLSKELGMGPAAGGFVFGAASLGIAVASPIGGALVDRFGPRRVVAAATVLGALACALRVFATGAPTLAATMLLFGLHVGLTAPAVPKALAAALPLDRVARANGLALLAYTLGTAATMATARVTLLPLFGSWQRIMLVAAGALVLAGAAFVALVGDARGLTRHARARDSILMIADPQLRLVAVKHFIVFGGYLALLTLLPRALGDAGLPPKAIGAALGAWLVAAGLANFLGPALSDRLGRRKPLIIGGALVAAVGLAGVAASARGLGGNPMIFLVIAALGGGSFAPLLLTLPFDLPSVGVAKAGSALGLLMLVGQAGGFLLPVLCGATSGALGAWAAVALVAALHAVVVLPALRLARR